MSTVTYHGSLTEFHGPATLLGPCDCDECVAHDLFRWELAPANMSTGILVHVRAESSFTEVK